MLAQSVVQEFGGRAAFVMENYGESQLARRFGVTRYPAIFVGDVLVATPKDFGFYGTGEGGGEGRYAPWKSAASHERFRNDLSRMVGLILAGRKDALRAEAMAAGEPAGPHSGLAAFPAVTLATLDGRPIERKELAGRPVLVEFWATWCPPCRGTLGWLSELQKRHGEKLAVVTIALESDSARVKKISDEIAAPIRWTLGSPELARAFGDVSAVPTLLMFDATGKLSGTWYGAPPTLHAEAEARLASILAPR